MSTPFGDRLRELREAAGVSQYALAKLAKVSKQGISILELGGAAPSWETVRKLARGLGVSVEQFDTADDPRDPVKKKPAKKKPAKKK